MRALNFIASEYISYQPPYDWAGVLAFLRGHVTPGVETADDESYTRTVALQAAIGAIRVTHVPAQSAIRVEYSAELAADRTALTARLQQFFDTQFNPQAVNAFLAQDPVLARAVARNPGMRIPGAFEHFELLIRSILGQQISIKAANTLAGRFAREFGTPTGFADERLTHVAPTARRVAECSVDEIVKLGIVRARAACIIAVAQAVIEGRLAIEDSDDPEVFITRISMLRGIGPWTAHYLAMRALHWTDAFPKEDIALRTVLGNIKASEAERRSQAWRPWRSYAVMHLWQEYLHERATTQPTADQQTK